MDSNVLVREQLDAGSRFIKRFAKAYPVCAAYWVKLSDEKEWGLYIASDKIDDDNFDVAYGEVGQIATDHPDDWLDMFQIKVRGEQDSLTRAVLEVMKKYPGRRRPFPYNADSLGGVGVDGVYIYPVPAPVAG